MSGVCRPQFSLNDNVSETTELRALIFSVRHWLVDLYQICSNCVPGIKIGPAAEGHRFEIKYTQKFSSPEPLVAGA